MTFCQCRTFLITVLYNKSWNQAMWSLKLYYYFAKIILAILVPLPFLVILEPPRSFLQKVLLEFLLELCWISIKFAFNFKCFSWVKYVSANPITIRKQISLRQQKIQWILNMCWLGKDIRLLSNYPKNLGG